MWLQASQRAHLQTYKTKTHARLMVEKATLSIAHDDDVCMMGESIEYLRMRLIYQTDHLNNNI